MSCFTLIVTPTSHHIYLTPHLPLIIPIPHVMSRHVISCHLMSCHLMSSHVMSCHTSLLLPHLSHIPPTSPPTYPSHRSRQAPLAVRTPRGRNHDVLPVQRLDQQGAPQPHPTLSQPLPPPPPPPPLYPHLHPSLPPKPTPPPSYPHPSHPPPIASIRY